MLQQLTQRAESLVELVPRRDMFESTRPNKRGNCKYHKEDEKGHSDYGNGSSSECGNRKLRNVLAIKRNDESEEAKPIEKKTSRVNSMVPIPKKRKGGEGLMFVDINIAGQKRSALIDTRASNLLISEKAARKLGLSIEN
ncbi:hypothetical protein J1N35_040419 [Gossypium stocksii]|uniref:Uncharacterized protein n=1 Tax=Gossypium stocksii TaxID=47602 RepID=A0A9D3UDJ5_9ROSI|nr:hypothetical protein J1N35_040419 [Gossypium stocksii]